MQHICFREVVKSVKILILQPKPLILIRYKYAINALKIVQHALTLAKFAPPAPSIPLKPKQVDVFHCNKIIAFNLIIMDAKFVIMASVKARLAAYNVSIHIQEYF